MVEVWRALSRRRVTMAVWALYGISALAMFGWPGLTGAVSRACHGQGALDVRSYWTAADARDLVAACGANGRAAYVRLELLDLVYPLLCGLALVLVSARLVQCWPGRWWRLLLIPAVAMTVLDYAENAAVWNILSTWSTLGNLPAHLGGAATAGKRAAGLTAYLVVPLLLLAVGLDRLRATDHVRRAAASAARPPVAPHTSAMGLIADDDRTRLDRDWIWRMLSTEASWHRWRSRTDVEAQIDGAWRVVGVYDARDGRQVGFARAVSDGVHDAYLADVIVEPGSRGLGIGKLVMRTMVENGPGVGFRWTLFNSDAHGFYTQFGFAMPDRTAMVRPSSCAATP